MPRGIVFMTDIQCMCMEVLIKKQETSIRANTILRNIINCRFILDIPDCYREAVL